MKNEILEADEKASWLAGHRRRIMALPVWLFFFIFFAVILLTYEIANFLQKRELSISMGDIRVAAFTSVLLSLWPWLERQQKSSWLTGLRRRITALPVWLFFFIFFAVILLTDEIINLLQKRALSISMDDIGIIAITTAAFSFWHWLDRK